MKDPNLIRNVAIIAHVDHGKTTMVDGLLKQSNTFRQNQAEMSQSLIMDSGDQESERGITITAKQTAVHYKDYKINIIDTPGHADFSGEVERTLNMADGVILIVDAAEGPMPQTKFVLTKALELGLKPIVVVNKVDKPFARIAAVEDEVADLFLELAIDEDQLKYKTYYSVGRDGKAWGEAPSQSALGNAASLEPIFEAIISEIPAPNVSSGQPQMLITALQYDSFLGKYAIGRINRGILSKNLPVALIKNQEDIIKTKIDKLFVFRGLEKEEVEQAGAGDIVAVTGLAEAHIGDTISSPTDPDPLPVLTLEAPTLSMYIGPNTSPMKGREGEFTTSRQINERLQKELETNVALQVKEEGLGFVVSGRGELHLSVLIEALRREGFELEVGRPQVVLLEKDGLKQEPVEELTLEAPAEYIGAISQELGKRQATLVKQETAATGDVVQVYKISTRALIGLRNILLTATKGTVIMNSLFDSYQPLGPKLQDTRGGALIAFEPGTTTPYALQTAEARGELFVGPGTEVYAGMIVGLSNRQEDLEINVCKAKHLTNMRSKSSDGTVQLTPFTDMSLEQAIDFLNDDELLEVTPKSLRLRKLYLDVNDRKRAKKHAA